MQTLKCEEESSRRGRGLEYLRDHDQELIALYYKQSDFHSAFGYRPPEEFEEQADQKVEVYGSGENVAWIDTLYSTPRKVKATDVHAEQGSRGRFFRWPASCRREEDIWLPPGIRTPIC